MRRAFLLDINEIGKYYTITEDGRVYSKVRGRWLKPRHNTYGYIFYSICKGIPLNGCLGAFAHTLVALKYIGKPPSEKHEIYHIDNNKSNNHYTNLQWVTHSQNQLKAYRLDGRESYWLNKERHSPDIVTRMKMANAKKKRVMFEDSSGQVLYESIEDAAVGLNTYRKKIYLFIRDKREFNGGMLSIVDDVI
jgi:hypothetical protein